MKEIQNQNNPTKIAEYFSSIEVKYGFNFDFCLVSLENEVDKFIVENSHLSEYTQSIIEPLLTTNIGETIYRLYNGKWSGKSCAPLNETGLNHCSCWIEIDDFKYKASQFIEYYLGNGKKRRFFLRLPIR